MHKFESRIRRLRSGKCEMTDPYLMTLAGRCLNRFELELFRFLNVGVDPSCFNVHVHFEFAANKLQYALRNKQ